MNFSLCANMSGFCSDSHILSFKICTSLAGFNKLNLRKASSYTEAVMTGIERHVQITPTYILLKLGKRVLNMSLEASSFNCASIAFILSMLTIMVHFPLALYVVISEVMMTYLPVC